MDDPAKEYKAFYLVDSNYVRTLAATASRRRGARHWMCRPEASLSDTIPLWSCVSELEMDAWLFDLSDLATSRGLRYVLGPTHLCDVCNWLCFVFMSSATFP